MTKVVSTRKVNDRCRNMFKVIINSLLRRIIPKGMARSNLGVQNLE